MTNNTAYKEALVKLDIIDDNNYSYGLAYISELELSDFKFSYYHRIHLEKAKRLGATAVYFKDYPDHSRPPIPQFYIYDEPTNDADIIDIHRNIWSSSEVRLYITISKTEVKVFNASKPIDLSKNTVEPFDILSLVSSAVDDYKKYSAKKFDNGTFWEETKLDFGYCHTAYESLIKGLKLAREKFTFDVKLEKKVANKLLVLSILIKYLEEREDTDEKGVSSRVFSADFFNKSEFGNAKDFIEVIKNGGLLNLFEHLSRHFNGKIFYLSPEYKKQIEKVDLTPLIQFLEGKIDGVQYVLWRLYSFNYLPVELISSIYEMFLEADNPENDGKGIAYTPTYLVNFMIDECMPIDKPVQNYKILDPACGSGVFLVAAYKRLIDWWQVEQHKKTGNWIRPEKKHLQELKNLLKNNIFGVDVIEDAVELAIFSLSLALCDRISPKVIWENLRFDNLEDNIVGSDFFSWLSEDKYNSFDLVIGNPPFVQYNSTNSKINNLSKSISVKVPKNQSALHFAVQGIKLTKKNSGLLAFILPAGPLLYNSTNIPVLFREWFFNKYNVPQIVDFTYLSNVLFKSKGNEKNVAVAAFFIENTPPNDAPIYHITAKKLKSSKERLYFELDHYDFHKVNKQDVLEKPFIWKTNLFGGGRLIQLIDRLSKFQTFEDFLNKRKKNGWFWGEGFFIGNRSNEDKECIVYQKPYLQAEGLKEDGIDLDYIEPNYSERRLETLRSKELFSPPVLLIKENLGKASIPVDISYHYLTFGKTVVGVHAPKKDLFKLEEIRKRIFSNNLFRFYLLVTSSRAGVSRSSYTLLKKDIMSLPFPENIVDIELSVEEHILVEDTLNYGLELLGKEKSVKALEPATNDELEEYGKVFCSVLNTIFKKDGKSYFCDNIYKADSFTVVSIGFSTETSIQFVSDKQFDEQLNKLIYNQIGNNYRINRIIKFFDGDRIIFLKPKNIRYWLKSVALRDADETISDLFNAGY